MSLAQGQNPVPPWVPKPKPELPNENGAPPPLESRPPWVGSRTVATVLVVGAIIAAVGVGGYRMGVQRASMVHQPVQTKASTPVAATGRLQPTPSITPLPTSNHGSSPQPSPISEPLFCSDALKFCARVPSRWTITEEEDPIGAGGARIVVLQDQDAQGDSIRVIEVDPEAGSTPDEAVRTYLAGFSHNPPLPAVTTVPLGQRHGLLLVYQSIPVPHTALSSSSTKLFLQVGLDLPVLRMDAQSGPGSDQRVRDTLLQFAASATPHQ